MSPSSESPQYLLVFLTFARNILVRDMTFRVNFIIEAAAATPEFERAAAKVESRRGFLIALPAYAYLVLFFAIPLVIVAIYSVPPVFTFLT